MLYNTMTSLLRTMQPNLQLFIIRLFGLAILLGIQKTNCFRRNFASKEQTLSRISIDRKYDIFYKSKQSENR